MISNNVTSQEGLNSTKNWYAFYTKPRHEFKVALSLDNLEIENFLPTITKTKQWSDRKKRVTEPLIRGYIFVCSDETERLLTLQQDGIINCICFNGRPASIPSWQIESLKKMLSFESDFTVSDTIAIGEKVKIISGPFEGVIGVVDKTTNNKLISVTINLLKRSVSAFLPKESVIRYMENE